jgi:hypothetical protein
LAGHVACKGEIRNVEFWFEKREWERPLGRHKHRWEDNIKMDLKGTWWEDEDWIYLAQDRDHAYCEHGNEA